MSDFQHKNDSNLFDISKISENFNVASESLKNVSQNYVPDTDIEEVILDESPTIKIPHNDWIFGEKSEKTGQFGGDQGSLKNNSEKYINDPIVRDIVNKYYNDFSQEDLELLFYRMNSCGCGYVASINTIMLEYIFRNETEFLEKFGFNPYDLAYDENHKLYKDFNYEYLFLDFYLYYAKNYRGFKTIEEVYGNAEEEREVHSGDSALDKEKFKKEGMEGTYLAAVGNVLKEYLNEKGIKIHTGSVKMDKNSDAYMKKCRERGYEVGTDLYYTMSDFTPEVVRDIINSDKQIVLSMSEFSMYYPYDKDGNGKLDDVYSEGVGPHEMYLVGTTSDPNKYVVSSWGKEFLVDIRDGGKFISYEYER